MSKRALDSITIEGVVYKRMNGNSLSSCAQCDIKSNCWDLYHYDTPCKGGYYQRQ